VKVILDGGELTVDVGEDLHVDLAGWAVPVFQGDVDVDQIASQSLGRAER
jgi:diaminopimelate epimerase